MQTPQRYDADRLLARLDRFDLTPFARGLRARVRELLCCGPQDTVVDVGCGGGRAVAEISAEGPHAVGVDLDPRMLDAARSRHPEADLRPGNAYELPLADASVQGYRAEKVYHSLDDPARALSEAYRVLAPGGRIVLAGQDWDAYMVDAADSGTTRSILRSYADRMPDARAPRRQRALLLDAGFHGVEVEGSVLVFTDEEVLPMLTALAEAAEEAGAVSAEQAASWTADQRERAREGRLFAAVPFFVVSAVRP
ncbi:methyltransferase domain-containing protein [Nocardiopsis ganjiahuensis]|uniref:methyltransferase domain-containing protein n=1 Tax=Nocardiopsis ganjiahuensis TaxID=239984 RepID=UPI00034ACC5E|nr:methyltransferase domain-containing protein [Nocardiopsis ganjiahuensis]